MVRFIHTSDWQLGMTRHYLDADAQPRFTADRIRTVRRILELAHQRHCDFVVVAGDVFEHPNLGRQDIGRAMEAMGSQAVPVFLLPGNHDPLGTGSMWSSPLVQELLPANVTVLDRVGTWPVASDVELVAAPWSSKRPDSDPVAGSLAGIPADGTVRIVVGHGMLEELEPDKTSPVMVRRAPLEAALAAGQIHYVALGDRHIRWPEDSHGAIHYSGTHESTDFREPGRGQVLEVELEPGHAPSITSLPVGSWQHVVIERQLNTAADLQELADAMDALDPKENIILKTAFTGSLTVSEHAHLDEILEQRHELFASVQQWERHTELAVVPDNAELAQAQWGGYVQQTLEELMARSQNDGDPAAQDALRLLIRFAGGVRA
ncbi:metallophosphoesterase family protein [Kocuria sp.]|uniref:metallophosphoesterase family protein n=1 Tax=Kocuria sp. TaxID=1871328 RepID=UPI0026E10789|nr:exonuclease SbcCD subunit D [Kocuria sp.]MDO5617218.1 exonuclease SbcCD subunit D [Kocuria sp.]